MAKLVAASFLGLCVDGLLKDSGANIMAAAQEPFNPAFALADIVTVDLISASFV